MRTMFAAVLIAAVTTTFVGVTPGKAQDRAENDRLITVSGEGTVQGAPNLALITLGVVSEATGARAALDANSQSMKGILDALKAGGMEARDLQTSGFSVDPVYSQPPSDHDPSQPFRSVIVGYRVQNSVTLRIRDLSRVGALLDQVVTLGANSISGPTFTVEDSTELEDQARRAAVADALRKGRLYAEAAELDLGPIFRIDESYIQPPQPMAQGVMMRMEAAASDVPIEGGELTFQVQVSVSWRIDD